LLHHFHNLGRRQTFRPGNHLSIHHERKIQSAPSRPLLGLIAWQRRGIRIWPAGQGRQRRWHCWSCHSCIHRSDIRKNPGGRHPIRSPFLAQQGAAVDPAPDQLLLNVILRPPISLWAGCRGRRFLPVTKHKGHLWSAHHGMAQ
jgi:hypothetical protein